MKIDWVAIPPSHKVAVVERCLECDRPFLTMLPDGQRVPENCVKCWKEILDRESERIALKTIPRSHGEAQE